VIRHPGIFWQGNEFSQSQVKFSQAQVKIKTMSLTLYTWSCIVFSKRKFDLVKLKSSSKNELGFVHVFLHCFCWIFNFSQTQVKLKTMSLTLYMWSCIVFTLSEKFDLLKLKPNSKKWVWLGTCVPALVSSWIVNLVKLNSSSKEWVWLCTCGPALFFFKRKIDLVKLEKWVWLGTHVHVFGFLLDIGS